MNSTLRLVADSFPSPVHSLAQLHLVSGYAVPSQALFVNIYIYQPITTKDTSKDPELFGIEHGNEATDGDAAVFAEELEEDQQQQLQAMPQKRHIGAVYRSGFLPSYRYLRSPTGSTASGFGGAGGRFSRSGRARQLVWVNGDGSMCIAF